MTTSTGEERGTYPAAPDRSTIPVDTFAMRVMLARAHVGLNIEDAAQKCGLNRQSWSNWERGMKPRDLLEVTQAISEGLDIDRDWLLFGGPLAKPEPASRRRRGDRHGRREDTGELLRKPRRRPRGRAGVGPAGRRDENDRPRLLRAPL